MDMLFVHCFQIKLWRDWKPENPKKKPRSKASHIGPNLWEASALAIASTLLPTVIHRSIVIEKVALFSVTEASDSFQFSSPAFVDYGRQFSLRITQLS